MISIHKLESKYIHPLARFVTPDAIALILAVRVEDIHEIRCWHRVILVIGRHFSRFVSYADLPPILGVELPTVRDFVAWRKRWQKNRTFKAPTFWQQFYTHKYQQAASTLELSAWQQLISTIENVFSSSTIHNLYSLYAEHRDCLQVET